MGQGNSKIIKVEYEVTKLDEEGELRSGWVLVVLLRQKVVISSLSWRTPHPCVERWYP